MARNGARYRKVVCRFWHDEKVRTLSDDGRLAFLYLLTNSGMTSLGAMKAFKPLMARELGWNNARFDVALGELIRMGMVVFDESAMVLVLPNFPKHNQPGNPSIVKSWETVLSDLPECDVLRRQLQNMAIVTQKIGKGWESHMPETMQILLEKPLIPWPTTLCVTPSDTPCSTPCSTPCAHRVAHTETETETENETTTTPDHAPARATPDPNGPEAIGNILERMAAGAGRPGP